MKRKKVKQKINRLTAMLVTLLGIAFLLIFYLIWATDRLIMIQAANAAASQTNNLPSQTVSGAGCGT